MTGQVVSTETRIEIKYREDARGNAGKPVLEGGSIPPASTNFCRPASRPKLLINPLMQVSSREHNHSELVSRLFQRAVQSFDDWP